MVKKKANFLALPGALYAMVDWRKIILCLNIIDSSELMDWDV